MYLCKECEKIKKRLFHDCMGDGMCEKHGRYSFYRTQLKQSCQKCAREKNICQICGSQVEKLMEKQGLT
jgi:hypothetical protein